MSAWLAANRGDRQALCQELDSGADMEFKDPMGRTALMEAAKHGHVACVQELLYRGADPTARSAVGWTAVEFCGGHGSSNSEIHQLLGEAQQVWHENHQQQPEQQQPQQQQKLASSLASRYQVSNHADKENTNSQLVNELPNFSSSALTVPVSFSSQTSASDPFGHLDLHRQYTADSDPSSYKGFPPQASHQQSMHYYQLQQQQLPQSQPSAMFLQSQRSIANSPSPEQLLPHSYSYPPTNSHTPMLSQGALAQATLARLSKASTEAAISSVTSSMHSFKSSELSNVSITSNSLLSSGLNSPFLPAQQSPATLSRPVCRYWHSGRCLYGAHCRFAHPAGPAPTPQPSVQPVCRYWRFGTCRYGSACRFRHPMDAASLSGPTTGGLPGFQTQFQQQQQQRPAHNMGLTDAEVLSLISQGSKPLQDTHSLLNTLQKLQLSQR